MRIWHSERIIGFGLTSREKHLLKSRQYIIGKLAHLHFVKVVRLWNKGLLKQPHYFASIIIRGLAKYR